MNSSLVINDSFINNHWEIKISRFLATSLRPNRNPLLALVENTGLYIGGLLFGFVERKLLSTISDVQELTALAKTDASVTLDEDFLKVYTQLKSYQEKLVVHFQNEHISGDDFLSKYIRLYYSFIESIDQLHAILLHNTELAFDVSEEEIFNEWRDRLVK